MSYMTPSLTDFLLALNTANSTSYTVNDITFGAPEALSGTWKGVVTTRNTGIRVTAKAGGAYMGKRDLTYDRLNLASLTATNLAGFQCSAYNVTDVHSLLPMLKYWTGIQFSTDDLVNNPLVDNGNNTSTTTLQAKAGSLGWIGSATLIVTRGAAPIDQLVTVTSLNGLNYPTANDQDTFGALYLYPYDYTSYFSTMSAIAPGVITSTQADALVAMLLATDLGAGKALWANNPGATAWNLSGATVVSNGLNTPALPTNSTYKYVMGLQLDPAVLTPAGLMYLHYNDPFDAA
jgi:hypothetical protein